MISLEIHSQPDDESCGPTSLQSIYKYYGDDIPLADVMQSVERVHEGGTLAALLGKHALNLNYSATLYVYNLNLFDPSWFNKNKAEPKILKEKLKRQLQYKNTKKMLEATQAVLDFIDSGGEILYKDLTVNLLKYYFTQNIPIIAGLSATYLYNSPRETYDEKNKLAIFDDVIGKPCGHFVVLCGYDDKNRHIVVADPHRENPISQNNYYRVSSSRLINAIMLGILTNDSNLLIIKPRS